MAVAGIEVQGSNARGPVIYSGPFYGGIMEVYRVYEDI